MKHKLLCLAAVLLLLLPSFFIPTLAQEGAYSELATAQSFYSLIAYARMCKGRSPLYILDSASQKGTYQKTGSVDKVASLIDGVLAFQKGNGSVQEWIDTDLAARADKGAEWFIIGLSQNGDYDFKLYEKSLLTALEKNPPASVQTAQKFALTLLAVGSKDDLIFETANRPIDSSPLSAWIFGLHLLNNGVSSTAYTTDAVIDHLIGEQRQDGGWAIMGQYGDVDMTAMVLQALAPHYQKKKVKTAVDRAVVLLSSRQNDDGGFSSMGAQNCESTAQVLTALSALQIDAAADARFQKNGKSVIDGLLKYRRSDGSFSHVVPNESAESQKSSVTEKETKSQTASGDSASSAKRTGSTVSRTESKEVATSSLTEKTTESTEGSVGKTDKKSGRTQDTDSKNGEKEPSQSVGNTTGENAKTEKKEAATPGEEEKNTARDDAATDEATSKTEQKAAKKNAQKKETEPAKEEKTEIGTEDRTKTDPADPAAPDKAQTASANDRVTEKKTIGYKPIAAAILCLLALGAAALLFMLKKATRKNLLLTGTVFLLLLAFVFGTNFESIGTHKQIEEKTDVVGTVTLSIRCDTVAGKGDSDFIPSDGCILATTAFDIESGDTVYDVLEEATKRFNIHMEKKGTSGMIYVEAIGHLYELQFGEMSGWVYHVNGDAPLDGCDAYTLSDGDEIEWMYTLDLGADVGNTFEETEGE